MLSTVKRSRKDPNRAPTQLSMRLALPETRPAAIAAIVEAYRIGGSLRRAAEIMAVGERSLNRFLEKYPDLARALESERAESAEKG